MKKLVVLAIFALSLFAGSTATTRENPIPGCYPCSDQAR
jgi:hypothetical protein